MKHLKLRGVLSPCHTKVTITVLEQTHIGEQFGRAEKDNNNLHARNSSTFRHGAIRFKSNDIPTAMPRTTTSEDRKTLGVLLWLYVRGANPEENYTPIETSAEFWPAIKEAVKAYNRWGKRQP